MLTIENIQRIKHKPLGKRNFYVESVKEGFDASGNLKDKFRHKYYFTISNRTYSITITLDRSYEYTIHNDTEKYYRLQSSTGDYVFLESKQIANMDIVIDKLRYVALTKFN